MNDATLVTVAGRDPERQHGVVNPPVYHASTILFPTVAAMEAARPQPGRLPTAATARRPPSRSRRRVATLEGGHRSIVVGSGKTAITSMLLALLRSGDHLLVADTVYAPTRHFCTGTLARFGIETTYYDPALGAGIADADPARDPAGVHRGAGLAHLRDAGHPGHRRGGARAAAAWW